MSAIEERIANLKAWPIAHEGRDALADMVRELAAGADASREEINTLHRTIAHMQEQKQYADDAMSYIIREVEWTRIFPRPVCDRIKAVAASVKDGKPIPLPKP